MGTEVTLPLWSVLLLTFAAALAVLDRLLIPSVRWAIRRRAGRVIDELNTRLQIHIQPFKMTRRQVLIDSLLADAEVLAAVEQHMRETGAPRDVAVAKARKYAREIVPSFSAYTYFKVGTRLARRLSQALYRVRLGYTNDEALRAVSPDASVIFVINHRSNMDYVLVTYIAASSSALSYAVGEWAQVWGIRGLIRSMGAYFIRRNSKDGFYRKILARYVDMATKAGVVQAMFPEGGLSRDGTLGTPKLGLLSYMVAGFDPNGPRDIVFIPVGLNYDRVLEDRVLIGAAAAAAKGDAPRFSFHPLNLVAFVTKAAWRGVRGRWYRNGYACVSFGTPLSLRSHLENRSVDLRTLRPEIRNAEIALLGQHLLDAVGKVVPALPVALLARALMESQGRTLTPFELKGRVFALMTELESAGRYVHVPRHDRDYAIDVGLRMLVMRKIVAADGSGYRSDPAEATLLAYYANSIAHLLPPLPEAASARPGAAEAAETAPVMAVETTT